jgi:hypothetical protein
MPYAHSRNAAGQRHDLLAHLTAVAESTPPDTSQS